MITVNSLSGGKTSAYIAANFPADYNLFALVTSDDKDIMLKDKKLRQIVSDKIGREFIGTLEEDVIVHTMLDLEQYIGQEIHWVAGKTFDQTLIDRSAEKNYDRPTYLPNVTQRFCTDVMKVSPMFYWWYMNINEPVEMRIGFRANEMSRAKSMMGRMNEDGLISYDAVLSVNRVSQRRNWSSIPWQKPVFPLIEKGVYKDQVEKFWEDKPVRFAWMNNCVGCFHKTPALLGYQFDRLPDKMEWFAKQERHSKCQWRKEFKYDEIKNMNRQLGLFEDDFNECDSGYCGL